MFDINEFVTKNANYRLFKKSDQLMNIFSELNLNDKQHKILTKFFRDNAERRIADLTQDIFFAIRDLKKVVEEESIIVQEEQGMITEFA